MKKLSNLIGYMKEDTETRPVVMLIAVMLLALGGMMFPVNVLVPVMGELNAAALVRTVFGLIGIVFMLLFAFHEGLRFGRKSAPWLDVFLILLLLVVNNFPFIPLCSGKLTIAAGAGKWASYLWFCLSVGFFEEIFFRGLVLSLALKIYRNRRYALLYAVLLSSALFGGVHLINLIGNPGAIGAVALQIAYSAAFGAAYAFLVYLARSIWPAVLLHTVFDIGGLLLDYDLILNGNIWPVPAIVLTAVLGAIGAALLVVRFILYLKKNPYLPLSDKEDAILENE